MQFLMPKTEFNFPIIELDSTKHVCISYMINNKESSISMDGQSEPINNAPIVSHFPTLSCILKVHSFCPTSPTQKIPTISSIWQVRVKPEVEGLGKDKTGAILTKKLSQFFPTLSLRFPIFQYFSKNHFWGNRENLRKCGKCREN